MHRESLAKAKSAMHSLWLEYKPKACPARPEPPPVHPRIRESEMVARQHRWRYEEQSDEEEEEADEYERYCKMKPVKDIGKNPIDWWIEHEHIYPNLPRLALSVLSIPAMSAECERYFSSASQLLSDRRNNLDAKTIEACECQKNWIINNWA
jgi:hAT family C-terminal dimerisation region